MFIKSVIQIWLVTLSKLGWNGRAMAGHDRLNVFGDAEVGHKETPRDVTDWTKAREGYTLGDIKHYGLDTFNIDASDSFANLQEGKS